MALTEAEISYLSTQPLGRLATVAPDGSPQVNPVGFRYDPELGVIDIGGHALAASKKFRNVAAGSRASIVVDDIVSRQPWQVRGVEIRGDAEALDGQDPLRPGFSAEIIRIHPRRVISWGVEPGQDGMTPRDVA
ncbi:MAG: PPOX class F420-dependent oxidoreductase [Actinophytocola sp.]|uniref:PPOX class F420-dependent oxidoreductase n=1 Tax=Actinophytocola sp. TaxID=1872138 RepID=UPI001322D0C0|nr:PPOX class F420-dependent oxidoreductase [Actinophytocola sp.]MPZ85856.1 PPOX class F420-dependent oxidoreductase [Actinophytocola sp.]